MKPTPRRKLRAPDGTRLGDPIPGSRMFRGFCGCGQPVRTWEPFGLTMGCERCHHRTEEHTATEGENHGLAFRQRCGQRRMKQ